MKTAPFLLAATLLLPALGAAAQTPGAAPASPVVASAYSLAATPPAVAGASQVLYFGVVNSHNASHEQVNQLQQAFERFQPTLVVVEKPDMGTESTAEATIRRQGMPGYARLLAQQHQVPTERLDDPAAEYAYLRTQVEAEQLKLYYLLREAYRFRQRTGAPKDLTYKAMQALLVRSTYFVPGTENTIRNVAELAAAFHKYCPDGGQWWDAPAAYFCPLAAVALYPPGSFAHTLNATLSDYRTRMVYGRLAARAQAGERILVVMSCDQLPSAPSAGAVAIK